MPITLDGTTGIDAPLGTAATPSYGNTTATTTGLYFPTSTTLGLSTNGTAALTIDASQNVGIGTSSPAVKLDVSGSISATAQITVNTADGANQLRFQTAGVTKWVNYTVSSGLRWYNGTSDVLTIDSSGNVGVGTTSPAYKLDVNGTIQSRNASYAVLQLYNSGLASNPYYRIAYDAANNLVFNYVNSTYTSSTEQMRITSAGGVSFGSSGTAYGTSGQVLTSAGNAPPTWTTISTSASGTLIRAPQILTSGTSYTTPSNCTKIYVELVGGGGGGGGVNSGNQFGGFGGGGAYLNAYVTVTGSTAYTIAVGSGGAKGVASAGSAGGTTSIIIGATTYSAGGGGGGALSSGSNAAGGAGGTATNGNFNFNGIAGSTGGAGGIGGSPPSAFYNPSAAGTVSLGSGVGSNATYYGCGGGCAYTAGGSAGNGYQGVICIWEYT